MGLGSIPQNIVDIFHMSVPRNIATQLNNVTSILNNQQTAGKGVREEFHYDNEQDVHTSFKNLKKKKVFGFVNNLVLNSVFHVQGGKYKRKRK